MWFVDWGIYGLCLWKSCRSSGSMCRIWLTTVSNCLWVTLSRVCHVFTICGLWFSCTGFQDEAKETGSLALCWHYFGDYDFLSNLWQTLRHFAAVCVVAVIKITTSKSEIMILRGAACSLEMFSPRKKKVFLPYKLCWVWCFSVLYFSVIDVVQNTYWTLGNKSKTRRRRKKNHIIPMYQSALNIHPKVSF